MVHGRATKIDACKALILRERGYLYNFQGHNALIESDNSGKNERG